MKRGRRQARVDETLGRARSDSSEEPAPEAAGPRGLRAPASRRVASAVSEPQLPLPRELARMEHQPFVGRVAPLRRLRERWSESTRRPGGLVALGGEAGIGKTRLAARFAAEVHREGGTVLYGRADEDSVSPYQPFVETLRQYAAHRPRLSEQPGLEGATRLLGALVPELERSVGPSDRHDRDQLSEAVLQLLLHAASERPLLVILEDLHWADAPTVRLLRALPRRGAGLPVLVVATYRDPETHAAGSLA
jgi:predicted ATPase